MYVRYDENLFKSAVWAHTRMLYTRVNIHSDIRLSITPLGSRTFVDCPGEASLCGPRVY